MIHPFTDEEISIIALYDHTDRMQLIKQLSDILPYVEENETDSLMVEIIRSAISKLNQLSDAEFLSLPVFNTFPADDFEEES